MHVLSVVGARPQFIKAFPVSIALSEPHEETLVHTGQHYDSTLSDVFFEELAVPDPSYHLGIGSAEPGTQIGRMMDALQPILDEENPDVVLTYGDTNSTLAAAVAGAHHDAILAHVEAGLRSHNRTMPEEINRVLTDHASDLLFAPTQRAAEALAMEGINAGVHVTGDVMVDALRLSRDIASEQSDVLERLQLASDQYILSTVHRQVNTDNPARLRTIIATLGRLEYPVVLPAHPRTVAQLETMSALEWAHDQVHLVDPVGYLDFIHLLDNAWRVVTDSGGIQKEAFLLDTPCVTLRTETEWPETVHAGWNVLVDADPQEITSAINQPVQIHDKPNPFGDGTAATSIEDCLTAAIHSGQGLRSSTKTKTSVASGYSRGN